MAINWVNSHENEQDTCKITYYVFLWIGLLSMDLGVQSEQK